MELPPIKLKEKWDFPQCIEEEDSGVYQGREEEARKLGNIILKKCRSSVLLCAPRGRGKTSLIYKTLREARKQGGIKIIPIFIDAPQLESKKSDGVEHLFVLENIISCLNRSFGWRDIFVAKDFPRLLLFKLGLDQLNKKNLASKWSKEESKITSRSYFFSWVDLIFLAILLIVWLVYRLTGFHPSEQLIDFISFIVLLLIGGKLYHKFTSQESFILNRNFDTLQHDFKKLFDRDFKKIRFIFAIDELDFFMLRKEGDRNRCGELELKETIKSRIPDLLKAYKNLFQSVNATFLFVGDEKLYGAIRDSQKSVLSTIFTDLIYLAPPRQKDLKEYIDKIIENTPGDGEKWELIEFYLMHKGEGGFRTTINAIKDYTRERYDIIKFNNYEFSAREKVMAETYRLMSLLYDSLSLEEPSRQTYNEDLFESLYKIIQPKIWEEGGKYFGKSELYSVDIYIKKVQDFLIGCLKDSRVISVEEKENYTIIKGSSVVKDIPASFDRPTPNEQSLKKSYEETVNYIKEFGNKLDLEIESNKHIDWIEKNSNIAILGTLIKIKEQIDLIDREIGKAKHNSKFLREIKHKEETDPHEQELNNLRNTIENDGYNLIKKRISGLTATYEQELYIKLQSKLFVFLPDDIKNVLEGNMVFYINDDFSKQLAILEVGDDKIGEWQKEINKLGYSHSYKIVNTNTQIREVKEWMNNFSIDSAIGNLLVEKGVPCKKSNNYFILNKVPGVKIDGSGDINTFLRTRASSLLKGNFKFLVKVENGALINFVLGLNKEDDEKFSWWMVRLDTRAPSGNIGCGVLKKTFGSNWVYSDSKKKRVKFPADEDIEVFLDFSEKNIELYSFFKKTKRSKKSYKVIWARVRRNIVPGQFGFFNELGTVELKVLEANFDKQ